MQEAARETKSWDDVVPDFLSQKWRMWVDSLVDLSSLRFPRCLVSGPYVNSFMQLHFFSDASLKAYGSVCYLRCINSHGQVKVNLVASEGRVAPIKSVTIPRLELISATESVKLYCAIKKALTFRVDETYFWSDSQIVLAYIRNCDKHFGGGER